MDEPIQANRIKATLSVSLSLADSSICLAETVPLSLSLPLSISTSSNCYVDDSAN